MTIRVSRHRAAAIHTILAAALISATLVAAPALSQAADPATSAMEEEKLAGKTEVGLFVGWLWLADDIELGNGFYNDAIPDDGFVAGARGAFNLFDKSGFVLAVEGELRYAASSFIRDGASAHLLALRGAGVLHYRIGAWRPFVLGGIGAEGILSTLDATAADSKLATQIDFDSASHWGVGVKWDINDDWLVRADLRYINTAGREDAAGEDIDTSHAFEAHIGASVKLGGESRDSDRDGLRDDVDRCPLAKEDEDGFEDDDGCPDPDNDKDGIEDADDKCPNEAEVKNGIQDEDGCPDSDKDKDGIEDRSDTCPEQAEDKDGFQDADGCPDDDNDKDAVLDKDDRCPNVPGVADEQGCPVADKDKDGIPDKTDKCPDEAETFNGFKDEDGCPDKKATVIITEKEIKILEKVYFETGKATIRKVSFDVLNAVASVVKLHPEITIILIEGHTDDVGKDDANLQLSAERAEAVKQYFVDKGVAVARLQALGRGETAPMCTDVAELLGKKQSRRTKKAVAACREQNRRVQFKITEIGGKKVDASDTVVIEEKKTFTE